MTLQLEGYRIVEQTEVWAGPFGTTLLADLGAEVIRVESYPRAPDGRPPVARQGAGGWGAGVAGDPNDRPWERSTSYHMVNRNKKGITLNLAHPKGKELFYRLISLSDAYVIGYTAGTAARLGTEYAILREYKPDLVMVSMPGWGEKGPYKGYATWGSGLDAFAGHHYLRGYPDLDPSATPSIFHSDATGALMVAFAVAAALYYRERTGKGQFIDLSQVDVLMTHLPRPFMEWVMNQRVVQPLGNADPTTAPHGCYPCKDPDTWITIAVRSDAQWHALRQAMGEPAWATAERFASLLGRLAHRQELDAHLAEWTRQFTPTELFQKLATAGVPAGPVYTPPQVVSDPQMEARGFYPFVDHPVIGPYQRPGPLWRMSRTPVEFRRHTNLVGEHNREIYCGLLGLTEDDLRMLEAEEIIGTAYKPGAELDRE